MAKLHPIAAKLLADIEAYCARSGVDRTTFGRDATGDGFFITRLERGTQPRLSTIDKVYRYIERRSKPTERHKTP